METVPLSVESGSAEDATLTIDLAREVKASWIVADGYHFGAEYQRAVKNAGQRLLFIDDNGHAASYHADIVLNQNAHAHASLYENRDAKTHLLLGTRYALLRREFLKWRGWQREFPIVARKVLVTMGGADPNNATLKVVQALKTLDIDFEAIVVIGRDNPHSEELRNATHDSQVAIRLEKSVTNMPELMAWADVAVSAGGSTCWELTFMGLPFMVLVLAENQYLVARHLVSSGTAMNMGWFSEVSRSAITKGVKRLLMDKELRVQMSSHGKELIDGEGAARVVDMMRPPKLKLRCAREDDCRLLWEWASDPTVRSMSFSSASIPWEEHVSWFTQKLRDPSCAIFIGLDMENLPVGQVRFDIHNQHEAEIDVSIEKESRGAGYASVLIDMAVKELLKITPVQLVHAFIKLDNSGSIRAFKKANFKDSGLKNVNGEAAGHYTRTRTPTREDRESGGIVNLNQQSAGESYVVVGSKTWSRRIFDEVISKNSGCWYFIGSSDELNEDRLKRFNPRYIFFLHWSWKVPNEIVEDYECICFHMTDVPYGRGGSPLQNLIIRGHHSTKLSALRMTSDFDAGPVYLKKDLSLEGRAEEIYLRANYLAAQMIDFIISESPAPVDQEGEPVVFKRRKAEESEIPDASSLSTLYDFIRMLDAEGYPLAFINHRGFRYEFSRANLHDARITANVVVTPIEENDK